ncbi:MAG: tRNA (cytidine(34)-2'-O)-methyltransferase [Oscillospiraceae bacterium]|nr:tRNA (cytidine(34)-2'-O)-methyltransferase [Oscillospiraceae bacterium]
MHIALHEPQIPQNTGNVVRTCSATGSVLHLIEPLGFTIDDSRLKRAGLDYWHGMDIRVHPGFDAFLRDIAGRTLWLFTTKGSRPYHEARFSDGDCLVFGKETEGLPEAIRAAYPEHCLRLPMLPGTRSLNLSNSVAVALYEALRQQAFADFV